MRLRRIGFVAILTVFWMASGCGRQERLAREAMAVLAAVPGNDEAALDAAYGRAVTQAYLVEGKEVRESFVAEINQLYRQRKEPFEAARREAAERQRRQREIEDARELARVEEEKRREREREQREAARETVQRVKWTTRFSDWIEGTKVLVFLNDRRISADFQLTCYALNGASKTMPVSVPAHGRTEIGFLEGWSGNFVPGEWCVAYHDGERQWRIEIP